MMYNRLHVSRGNDKLGKRTTANVSLLPIITCQPDVPCAKDCYARRLAINKETIKAWMDNTAFAVHDPAGFGASLFTWLVKHKTAFFRWHVAGDVPSLAYQAMMKAIAVNFLDTRFLAMTKWPGGDWLDQDGERIGNLSVIYSTWPGSPIPNKHELIRRGFNGMNWQEGDERAPKHAVLCKGACDHCRACWADRWVEMVLHKH